MANLFLNSSYAVKIGTVSCERSPKAVLATMTNIGKWSVASVAAHPCDVFEPFERNPHGYVVIYLHGVHLGKLNDKQEYVEQFERYGLPVISPITQRSWWTDRICAEFDPSISAEQHILDNILPYVRQRWGSEPPRIALLGTSMGGQGALRFSYKFPDVFPIVAAISPAIDYQQRLEDPEEEEPLFDMYDDPEAARQDTALLHIHPLNWPRHQFFCCCPTDHSWYDSADRLRMKLSSLGVPFESDLETEGGGHGFDYYGLMAARSITFIANALESERLRVV